MTRRAAWIAGLAVGSVALVGVAVYATSSAASPSPAPGPTPAPPGGATPGTPSGTPGATPGGTPGPAPAPGAAVLTLGTATTLAANAGQMITLALPPGSTWTAVSGTATSSSPAAGSKDPFTFTAPATAGTYTLSTSWLDGGGTPHGSTITVTVTVGVTI